MTESPKTVTEKLAAERDIAMELRNIALNCATAAFAKMRSFPNGHIRNLETQNERLRNQLCRILFDLERGNTPCPVELRAFLDKNDREKP